MPLITKRCKKIIWRRGKKRLTKLKIREVWKDIVEYEILTPLLKTGFVQVDKSLSFEIVGSRIVDNQRMFNLMSKGLLPDGKGGLKPLTELNPMRRGMTYKIVMVDRRAKSKLQFRACAYIRKRVSEELKWTNTQYRIEEVNEPK